MFTTPVHIDVPPFQIAHSSHILMLGSCFAESVSERMRMAAMPVTVNPFGVLYNPASISQAIRRILDNQSFVESELVQSGGMWHSMLHHGTFSSTDKEDCLQRINESLLSGRKALLDADLLIITFGTSYVYEMNGQIVGNCHKLPASAFTRRRLSIQEIANDWNNLLNRPELQSKRVIFTVSPIRHIKDGLHENQLSKSSLLLAINELCGDNRIYFPSYEIMMDELRDYRFYADDMLHPSSVAVDYIWQRFSETFFSKETQQAVDECTAFSRDLQHRPLHPDTPQCIAFLQHLEQKETALRQKYPYAIFCQS